MPPHISFRDYDFWPSEKGVRIRILTDTPCHLWARVSPKPPWIHKTPIIVRGLPIKEDIRFCFTVFEDNEQYEFGDTTLHTFWKKNWPPCTTKWVYLWGYVNGQISSSTSPFFKYHNTGVEPVPPPEELYTFNAIEPNFRRAAASGVWSPLDLSYELHPDATGVIIQVLNTNTGEERKVGMRKAGTTYDVHRDMRRATHTWALCGVDDAKKIEVYAEARTQIDLWIMGYTNKNVHFLDNPIDVLPTVSDTWIDIDTSSYAPAAVGVILNVGRAFGGYAYTAVRMKGSTDEWYWSTWQSWPVVGVNPGGVFQIKMKDIDPRYSSAFVVGYFTAGASFATNGIDISPTVNDNWQVKNIHKFLTPPRWGIIETHATYANILYGAQKYHSRRDLLWHTYNHDWALVHCERLYNVELYGESPGVLYRLIGVTH